MRPFKIGIMPSLSEGALHGGQTPRASDILAMARTADAVGLDSFWLADHFLDRVPGTPESGQWEVFTFLSAVAAVTQRLALGPLVAATSFRNPALLAKMADSLDEISAGRFILGLGAGWNEPEYTAFGYPFDHRAARFEEALHIVVPLLREGRATFAGQYVSATDAVLRPRGPTPGGPPIWIGAHQPRMLRLAARSADGFNTVWHPFPRDAAPALGAFRDACREVGRDPANVTLSVGTFASLLAPRAPRPASATGIVGEAEQVAEELAGFAALGIQHLIVILRPRTIQAIEDFARVLALLDAR